MIKSLSVHPLYKEKISFYFLRLKFYALRFLLIFLFTSIFSVILFRFVPVPFTPLMIIRCVEQVFSNKPIILKKKWIPYRKMKYTPLAAMGAEDSKFMVHWGFDFDAIDEAIKNNQSKRKRKFVRGGSTISQQTAKNVFLWQGRNWIRKGLEVYFTLLIELFWSKERILEVYLNVIEMGNGIYGIEAASYYYFKKPANKLSKLEAASISAIFPNPRKWSATKLGPSLLKKRSTVLQNMNYFENHK